jgi:ferric-dicitrate binding protein FerR (iron transport regulator)
MKTKKEQVEKKKQLEKLWQKYSARTCSDNEFYEWCNLLHDEDQEEANKQFLRKRWANWQSPNISRNKLRQRWYYGAAAAVLLCLNFMALFLIHQSKTPMELSEQMVSVVDIPLSAVVLPDGTTVTLKEGSRLNLKAYFLSGNTREVALEGEAFFDIAHNPEKPFIVHTGQIRTTALGTAFSVKAVPGETSITVGVVEGKVKIEDGSKFLATLEADQQFTYGIEIEHLRETMTEAEKAIESEWSVDVETELDWKPNELIFRNMPFGDIVQELAVRYGVSIMIENEALKRQRIDALLDNRNSIEVLLQSLCALQHATYTVEGRTYTIRTKN